MERAETHEVWRGPAVVIMPDGNRITTERDVTRFDDWRDTALGPVNMGYVRLGPVRMMRAEPLA